MGDNQNGNDTKQVKIQMAEKEQDLTQPRQQITDAERKAIIREATEKACEEYDEVFKKLSKN